MSRRLKDTTYSSVLLLLPLRESLLGDNDDGSTRSNHFPSFNSTPDKKSALFSAGISLSNNFAHLMVSGNNAIAYFVDSVGIHDGIKQILDARLGKILVRRMLLSRDDVDSDDESNLMALDNISEPKAIPLVHND